MSGKTIELKPCPFCGCEYTKDEDDYVYAGDHEDWCPLGAKGGLSGNMVVPDDPRFIEAWEKRAPTIEAEPKWISVEERLPDSQADVLVVAFWHECWQTMIGWHSDDGKKWRVLTPHGERDLGGVTHWMPLPEPPKAVKP